MAATPLNRHAPLSPPSNRVLGPEPWNVAYPEPSVRPDDSRYGDNPNRVQRHTQFQVYYIAIIERSCAYERE